ncbi:paraquat-inducible protein A [Litoribacillus peritrichatus]|uniref:Paraquat-inducible protein A n=1 Tax=Litoribacillus peritrichatus TaxID=718191 RepID=A0ABP7N7B6_9GAMM
MGKKTENAQPSKLLLCPDCDLLMDKAELSPNETAYCSRCNAQVYRHPNNSFNKVIAFTLAGLLFYIPANFLPIMSFEMLGFEATNTMLNGVEQLFNEGYYWMAFLVLMCSVLVPLFELSLLLIIALQIKLNKTSKMTAKMLLSYQSLTEWGMLEVYMLGILVAYIKMVSMGTILIDLGLFCFIGMLLSALLAASCFDAQYAFEQLEQSKS